MKAIRLRNLRSLADTDFVELRPITLLLGRNSSGKSTFLRTFPLLRQSVESRTIGPVLWYGSYVDFGDFNDAVRDRSSSSTITLEFKFDLHWSRPLLLRSKTSPYTRLRHTMRPRNIPAFSLALELAHDRQDESTKVRTCMLSFADNHVVLEFDFKGRVTKFYVNSLNVLDLGSPYAMSPSGYVVPVVYEDEIDRPVRAPLRGAMLGEDQPTAALIEEIKPLFHANTGEDTIENVALSISIGSDEDVLNSIRQTRGTGKTWRRRVSELSVDSSEFKRIRDLKLASLVPFLLEQVDEYIYEFALGVTYSAPLRAVTERYYRPQNLAVEEVDFQGANLPMFLRNLTEVQRRSFRAWTEEHLGFSVIAGSAGGHISLRVKEQESGNEYNLADVGFGLSQVLPILAQLWVLTYRKSPRSARRLAPTLFAIEQPELHLHPAFQAKIADLLLATVRAARAAGQDVRLVVETHSETIVNRLGYRIAVGDAPANEVQVVLFEEQGPDLSGTKFVSYDDEGFLTNWPFGFFEPELTE